ncbi:MAG: antibiotic biosynthesis monooxygenase [Acidobacteria bacterium]|nr:antibiotic biosynthesis monooxygenase [Acidobacteriota bacterium]
MAATVHVVARYQAKPGKEREVEGVLTALVAPSRREIGCYQYDLLRNPADPCDFCFVERWGDDKAVDQHNETAHVKNAIAQVEGLVEIPPDIRRYWIL